MHSVELIALGVQAILSGIILICYAVFDVMPIPLRIAAAVLGVLFFCIGICILILQNHIVF